VELDINQNDFAKVYHLEKGELASTAEAQGAH
jgi:hypothetical protein